MQAVVYMEGGAHTCCGVHVEVRGHEHAAVYMWRGCVLVTVYTWREHMHAMVYTWRKHMHAVVYTWRSEGRSFQQIFPSNFM